LSHFCHGSSHTLEEKTLEFSVLRARALFIIASLTCAIYFRERKEKQKKEKEREEWVAMIAS
jgi:hypothetical protein